jgi:hypothetical protein
VRTDEQFDGTAYKHEFRTQAGVWIEVTLRLEDFVATFRGRRVPGAPPLQATGIRQIGFLIAGEQYCAFPLELERIDVTTTEAVSFR